MEGVVGFLLCVRHTTPHWRSISRKKKKPALKALTVAKLRQDSRTAAEGILSVSHKVKCSRSGVVSTLQWLHSLVAMAFRAQMRNILHTVKLHLVGWATLSHVWPYNRPKHIKTPHDRNCALRYNIKRKTKKTKHCARVYVHTSVQTFPLWSDRLHNKWLSFNNNSLIQHIYSPTLSQYQFHFGCTPLTRGLTHFCTPRVHKHTRTLSNCGHVQ